MVSRNWLISWRLWGVAGLLSGLALVAVADDAKAQSRFTPAVRERIAQAAAAEQPTANESDAASSKIKINHFQSPWSKVLSKLAEESGLTLVADRVPPGHFTRRDKTEYELGDVLKILNADMEPLGFRLIKKGQYLVVIDLPAATPRYLRPQIPGSRSGSAPASPAGETDDASGSVENAAWTTSRTEPAAPEKAAPPRKVRQPSGIRQVAAASDEDAAAEISIAMRHQSAVKVAGMLFKQFKPQAKLINEGPEGLPALAVDVRPQSETEAAEGSGKKTAAPPVTMTVAIDKDRNELLVQAPPAQAKAAARMIRKLDVPRGSAVQVHTGSKNVSRVTAMLQPQLDRLAQGAEREAEIDDERPRLRTPADPDADDDPRERPQPQPGEKEPAPEKEKSDLPGLVGGLKGDVSVEALPDLGVMIIKGNQKDVDSVMAIIREIERLSVGAAPDVHLLMLKYVNSEALAELLTTVYERLSTSRGRPTPQTQAVSFFPVSKPNAILIVASAADMKAVLSLAEELDQPVDPKSEFQAFPLKSAVATQAAETINKFYEERKGLGVRASAIADVRTNTVIVKASPRDLREVTLLIKKLDRPESSAVSQMRVFPLRSASADELAAIIQIAIQSVLTQPRTTAAPGGQGAGGAGAGAALGQVTGELGEIKSSVIQFLSSDGRQERLIRSGILTDIRVTADHRINALIVTAPEESMPLMAELIKQLDRPTSAVSEIKVFSLANGDAKSMATLLETLFTGRAQGQQGLGENLGIQVAGAEDSTSALIPMRFSVDSRTNSIIAVGGAEALRVVEAILLRLDESDIRQRESTVYRLKNSPAQGVANSINQFLTSQRDIAQTSTGLVSPFEQIEREVIVVPEPVSNSLLISATPRFFKEIRELVVKLDAAPAQVIIQGLLVEVTLDNTDEFGVELGLQNSVLFDRSTLANQVFQTTTTTPVGQPQVTSQKIISQSATPGFAFNNAPLGGNPQNPGIVGAQGLSNFSLGRINNDLGYGGLVLSASSEGVSLLLRALAARRRVDVLSRPQIRTLDNQLALIQVGQIVPVVNGVQQNGLVTSPIIQQSNAGIILQVTPRISPDGMVVMEVIAEKSRYQPADAGVPIFTDAANGNVIRAPIKDISTARAVVSIRNEQTVVLGGMITREQQRIERKVPWIGDVPYLGVPFRYDFNSTVRTELLIFLTPRVITSEMDSEWIKQVETQRIHFTEQEAEAIHGPILAVPAADPSGLPIELPPEYCPPDAQGGVPPIGVDETNVPTTQMPAGGASKTPPAPPPPAALPAPTAVPARPEGAAQPESLPPPVPPGNAAVSRSGGLRLSRLFKK